MDFPHWDYLVTIGDDLQETVRYVEPVNENFKTFSVEFVRLYLAIGSEIDVVAKLICEKVKPGCGADNINDYRETICPVYPGLPDVQVVLTTTNTPLQPWLQWSAGSNPPWWKSYNEVKHERNRCFADANLENTIFSFAGLLILNGYLYGEALERAVLALPSKLVKFSNQYSSAAAIPPSRFGYCLPGFTRKTGRPYKP